MSDDMRDYRMIIFTDAGSLDEVLLAASTDQAMDLAWDLYPEAYDIEFADLEDDYDFWGPLEIDPA